MHFRENEFKILRIQTDGSEDFNTTYNEMSREFFYCYIKWIICLRKIA